MNRKQACKILGVAGNCDSAQLKKRYRQLLHLVHPDVAAFRQADDGYEEYPYGIHEIQEAYAVLTGSEEVCSDRKSAGAGGRTTVASENAYTDAFANASAGAFSEQTAGNAYTYDDPDAWMRRDPEYAKSVWDAEENADAFCEREILQYIEDFDGSVLGVFSLIRGKYLWKPEEEFPLFLQSISKATGKLIQETEEEAEREIFGAKNPWDFDWYVESEARREMLKRVLREKLTYLLAQQFIDAANTLDQLVRTQRSKDGKETIYYIPASLERGFCEGEIVPGEGIFPEKMEQHRLFLKNQMGERVGYLSFLDDRMYYLVVPLFEQRRVQVKIRVRRQKDAEMAGVRNRRRKGSSHVQLDLWLKFKEAAGGLPEDSNSRIRMLLEAYKRELKAR